ncbi:MAG: glycosyltransferase family 2 protein [Methylophagaceae bacterium]
MNQEVSILIPHYKTLKMTQLCLQLIEKNTDLSKVEVIVIDNGSNDASSEYLKSVNWITLIIRDKIEGESGAHAHGNALDLALGSVKTSYFLSIHTDTFVIDPDWLTFLLGQIKIEDNLAGVGSWKLEFKPLYKRVLKHLETFWQLKIWYPIMGKGSGAIAGVGDNYYYLRSHCALYKTDCVRNYANGFNDGGEPAGKLMHRKLVDSGFKMKFLESSELSKYVRHLNHATAILNPELHGTGTAKPKQIARIRKELNEIAGSVLIEGEQF